VTLECAVGRLLASRFRRSPNQEDRALKIVAIEKGLCLQVAELRLKGPIQAWAGRQAGEQIVAGL
jgi:hypothetical protein